MNKLIRIALFLKPYHKVLYVLALLLVANMVRELLSPENSQDSFSAMWHLLALAWLALLNLMLHLFTRVIDVNINKLSFWARVKNKFQHWLMLFFTVVFISITFAVIVLSFRMWRIY